jgi:hypothetical protein
MAEAKQRTAGRVGGTARAYFRVADVRRTWAGDAPAEGSRRAPDLDAATLVPIGAPDAAAHGADAVLVFPAPLIVHVANDKAGAELRAGAVVSLSFDVETH